MIQTSHHNPCPVLVSSLLARSARYGAERGKGSYQSETRSRELTFLCMDTPKTLLYQHLIFKLVGYIDRLSHHVRTNNTK